MQGQSTKEKKRERRKSGAAVVDRFRVNLSSIGLQIIELIIFVCLVESLESFWGQKESNEIKIQWWNKRQKRTQSCQKDFGAT